MRITTIGRGSVGGTLATLWSAAGHEVTELGRDGGDASAAEVVLLAVPNQAVPTALETVTDLRGKVILDATNRLDGEAPPPGFPSIAEYVKATTDGIVAKAFNLNYGDLFEQAATRSSRPGNIWVGDDEARPYVERLSADIGMQALRGGGLGLAATQEGFGYFMNSISGEAGGLVLYRFAVPAEF